jgi:hypothetical protein
MPVLTGAGDVCRERLGLVRRPLALERVDLINMPQRQSDVVQAL